MLNTAQTGGTMPRKPIRYRQVFDRPADCVCSISIHADGTVDIKFLNRACLPHGKEFANGIHLVPNAKPENATGRGTGSARGPYAKRKHHK